MYGTQRTGFSCSSKAAVNLVPKTTHDAKLTAVLLVPIVLWSESDSN